MQFESKKSESVLHSLIKPVIDRNSASLEFESKSTSHLPTESETKNSPSMEFESKSTDAASDSSTEHVTKKKSTSLEFESKATEVASDSLAESLTKKNSNSFSLEFGSQSTSALPTESVIGKNSPCVEFESMPTEASSYSLSDSKENSPSLQLKSKKLKQPQIYRQSLLPRGVTKKNSPSLEVQYQSNEVASNSPTEHFTKKKSPSSEFESKATEVASDSLAECHTKKNSNFFSLEFGSHPTSALPIESVIGKNSPLQILTPRTNSDIGL